jgi:hypothetical protein
MNFNYDGRIHEHQMHFSYFLIMQYVNPKRIIDSCVSMWSNNTKNYVRSL